MEFRDEPLWWLTKDGDKDCLALYERHYSCYRYADGRKRRQFVGPGEKVVLRTKHADAMWVWRRFVDDGQIEWLRNVLGVSEVSRLLTLLKTEVDEMVASRGADHANLRTTPNTTKPIATGFANESELDTRSAEIAFSRNDEKNGATIPQQYPLLGALSTQPIQKHFASVPDSTGRPTRKNEPRITPNGVGAIRRDCLQSGAGVGRSSMDRTEHSRLRSGTKFSPFTEVDVSDADRQKESPQTTSFHFAREALMRLTTSNRSACTAMPEREKILSIIGVNCSVFRNESRHQSSRFIRQADQIADCLRPDRRHYTYVDPSRVASRNPGYCFAKAGWRKCGFTGGGLLIMERP